MADGFFFEELENLPINPTRDDILNYFALPLYPPYNPEPYQVKGDKPLMLILKTDPTKYFNFEGRQYSKSPLADLFYEHLNGFEVIYETDPMASIPEIVEKKLGGVNPDFVLCGYTYHYGLLLHSRYMNRNNIKFIFTLGDIECYEKQELPRLILKRVKCDYLLTNLLGVDWELAEIRKEFAELRHSITLQVPWAIDPKKYPDKGQERDIDVAFICSIDDDSGFHDNRKVIRQILEKITSYKVVIGNYYGDEYVDILNRSKIFVVESSERGAMVQKYLEGASCGAMLIGEIPHKDPTIFEDGVSIGDIYAGRYDNFLEEKVLYYLTHQNELREISRECRKRVLKRYDVSKIAKEFEEIIMVKKTIQYGVSKKGESKTTKDRVVIEKTVVVDGDLSTIEIDPDSSSMIDTPLNLPVDENLILIVDKERTRSPLLTDFQNRLCTINVGSRLKFVRTTDIVNPLRFIINNLGKIPAYIFSGFGVGKYLQRNFGTIRANNIKIISETGDPWLFTRQRYLKSVKGLDVVAFVCHSSDGIRNITGCMKSPLIVSPWGMDENKVRPINNKRYIDVTWVTTCTSFKQHSNKNKVDKIIKEIEGIDKFTRPVFGKDYYDTLGRSKIFVVAGRVKDTMVQKYVEGAMCGTLMVGEIPSEGERILAGNMAEIERGNYEKLEEIIHYYLEHEDERIEMARNCQKAMIEHRGLNIICKSFILELEDIINRGVCYTGGGYSKPIRMVGGGHGGHYNG